jgi:hypothetical protein
MRIVNAEQRDTRKLDESVRSNTPQTDEPLTINRSASNLSHQGQLAGIAGTATLPFGTFSRSQSIPPPQKGSYDASSDYCFRSRSLCTPRHGRHRTS